MNNFTRKVCVTIAAAAMSIGLVGIAGPAEARDSSWGCGGGCSMGR